MIKNEFGLFCLVMLLLFTMFYFFKLNNLKGKKINLERGVYISILITSIIALICSIDPRCFNLTIINIWFCLILLYYMVIIFEKKFSANKNIIIIYITTVIIINILAIFFKLSIYISIISLIIELIIFSMGNCKIQQKKYFHLGIIFLIQFLMTFLNVFPKDIYIYNIFGIIFISIYSYFSLENLDNIFIEDLKLERDYALENVMDKSAFLRNLSHEIRIPVNTIDGFSQVILESDSMEEIKEDAKDIRIASRDLVDIINGMIDLSMIESGTLQIINENYNVYEMLDGIVQIFNAKIKDKKIEFITNIDENIPEVLLGDSERISQILLNILISSLKDKDNGKFIFNVSSVKSSSICRLKIVIEDTNRKYIAQEIERILDGIDDKDRNITIRLKTAQYLIELMDGKLLIEEGKNKGTAFTITLDQKIIRAKQSEETRKRKIVKPFEAKDKRILIVDDNKLNLKVAARLLMPYKVNITEANSGQECLDILEHDQNFDLILMDDLMPGLSGTETLDIIKKISRVDGYYIPVVVLTANAISGVKEKYLGSGFEDYLAKPIDKYELDRILRNYLKKEK